MLKSRDNRAGGEATSISTKKEGFRESEKLRISDSQNGGISGHLPFTLIVTYGDFLNSFEL
jgi:hypothetical protein